MFKRNKKSEDSNPLNFKSKNYNMSDNYKSSDLVTANLEYVSSSYTPNGPIVERTNQKYIFEIIKESENIRYREIFTGFIADTENHYFDLPYVVNIKALKEEVPTVSNNIPKYGLLLLINEINVPKKVKVKK